MEHIKKNEKELTLINNPKYVGALELIMLRNFYYRDSYRKLMVVCLAFILIIGALTYELFYEIKTQPTPIYYATSYDGTPLQRIQLRYPNMDNNTLLTWATESTIAAYTLNFLNYRVVLQNSRNNFTADGFEKFLKALKASNNLTAVKDKKMVVYAKITGTPTITKDTSTDPSFNMDGAYCWQVEFPMSLIFENSNPADRIIQNTAVTLVITRMKTLEAPQGVGIDSMVLLQEGL